ncbi:DUF4114 domain-containing protein, partial [Adonisia turfae]|uniref:DUF4114 domain-containing protein n=1 Tax=Adonisia turfae TaxID=2950184 RepID=UPI002029AA53
MNGLDSSFSDEGLLPLQESPNLPGTTQKNGRFNTPADSHVSLPENDHVLEPLTFFSDVVSEDPLIAAADVNSSQIIPTSDVPESDTLTGITDGSLLADNTSAIGDLFVVSGNAGETITLRFQWTYQDAKLNNEIGVFAIDADGKVNGVAPGDTGFAKAALNSPSRQVLFPHGQQTGAWKELSFKAGDRLAFYLVQDSSTADWLAHNPDNKGGQGPTAFFSLDGANPDGVDHVRSQSFGEDIQRFAWEDLWGGGDQDFNDAVLLVSKAGVQIPGDIGQFATLTVDLLSQSAGFRNEMGFFLVDDAEGHIGNLKPGSQGYAVAALSQANRQVVFARGQNAGSVSQYQIPAGKFLGWYLIQDATTTEFLTQNPYNRLDGGPIAFFSHPGANPDGLSHVHFQAANEMVWEDMTGGGDRDYNDLIFSYELKAPPQVKGEIALAEGSQFEVSHRQSIVVSEQPSKLQFTLANLDFDTTDDDAINDAFEAALVDSKGNSLVHTITNGRDAFFNWTEGETPQLANGVSQDGQTITVNLASIAEGTEATLILRLVNNDDDTTTQARIRDIKTLAADVLPPTEGIPTPTQDLAESFIFEGIQDVSASLAVDYDQTSFNEETETLFADFTARNTGQYGLDKPLIVAVTNISDPTVTVLEADGLTLDGLPYYNLSNLVTDSTLAPGNATKSATLRFKNPQGNQFTYDLVFLGSLNDGPVITSEPNVEGLIGKPYRYDVDATDPEGDPITYSLVVAPREMTINPETGEIEWAPQEADRGTQSITVRVVDGRGGVAEQLFDVVVGDAPPNRPPVFTTGPVVDARVNTAYEYDADATDLDYDELTYGLLKHPSGMEIDPSTGKVTWTPTAESLSAENGGQHEVSIEVSDSQGGVAVQNYVVNVLPEEGNHDPVIVSEPVVKLQLSSTLDQAAPANLSEWSVIEYKPDDLISANWVLEEDSTVVRQTVNAYPSIFLSDFDLTNDRIEGSWRVDTDIDDDLMGFVFGYQDPDHFYLFDWKQATQNQPGWGIAEQGMSIKVVDSDAPISFTDLWPTENSSERVRTIFQNDISYQHFTDYQFFLDFTPGEFTITIQQDDQVIESITLQDDTYTSGKFGFYNFSQPDLVYSGFTRQSLRVGDYNYDVDAIDPDDDTLTYSLVEKPEGMEINPETGEISWFPSPIENQIIIDTFGDEDFFGFGSGNIGQPVPEIEFNNQESNDPSFTDLDARFNKRFRPEGNNDFEWSHDLSEALAGLTPSRASLEIAIGGIEDGGNRFGTGGLDDRLFIEDIEVTNAFDDLDQSTTGTGLVDFVLSDEQLTSFTSDGILDVFIQGGVETDSGQQFNESYFIDFARLSVETDNTSTYVTVRVEDGRGGADEQEFTIQFVDAPDIDLTIDEVTPSNLAVNGQTLALTGSASAEITNNGNNNLTQPFDVLFFEDTNANQTYDQDIDNVLGSTTITAPLAAGASQTVTADLAGTVSFLGVPIWGFVDSDNAVTETDETNNLSFSSHDCIAQSISEFDPVVEWNKREFTVEPNSNQVMMTPAVIDVNEDEIPDVVFSTYTGSIYNANGKLRAISGADGSEIWTVTNPEYEVIAAASVAIGDIDNDDQPEIIAGYENGGLIAFENDGTFKWKSDAIWGAAHWGGASIADLNQDGTPEIIIGANVLNNEGQLLWSGNTFGGLGQGNNGGGPLSTVADLDLDGTPEVVAGRSAYRADGSLYWNATIRDGFPAIGNFDDDPNPEIVVVSSGRVHLLEYTGELKWGNVIIPGGGRGGPPTIADLDGDGEPEIGVASANRYVVFEADGSVKWQKQTRDNSSNVTGSSVFDFDGDGQVEVVYGDELFLRIYNGSDGEVLYELPKSSGTTYELPVIADVDADGNAEIVAVANQLAGFGPQTGIFVIGDRNDTWVSTRQIWNQHAYSINNVNDDGTIPTNPENSWQTHNTFRLNAFPEGEGNALAAPDLVASYL